MEFNLPSTGTYRVNMQINGIPLDECSFAGINDKIQPFFEESVSKDPDVTGLLVFLRDSRGEITGNRILYGLSDYSEQNEIFVQVRDLDNIPVFPLPDRLPAGRYTVVSQVMGAKNILQRTEKHFYYLGNTFFAYDGINIHLPGVTKNLQPVPRGMVVMLEAKMDFDDHLDPYIIWYNGRRKISEGSFSDGAGNLLWKAPDQSGFFNLRAEIFPVREAEDLTGYQKEISLLVSSRTADVHLVTEDISQLANWYIFEGNLNDSKSMSSAGNFAANIDRALKPAFNNSPKWLPANGTYGLATGFENIFALPGVTVSGNRADTWQALFRFMPLNDGGILSVSFRHSPNISMTLSKEGQNLVLTLASPSRIVSQICSLPSGDSFVTAGISFSVLPGLLSAKINVIGSVFESGELAVLPLTLESNIGDEFQILLGFMPENISSDNEADYRDRYSFNVLWDEFALFNTPPAGIISAIAFAAQLPAAGQPE